MGAVHLAVDLGASSGRVMAGRIDPGGAVELAEVHRFANGPVRIGESLHWDALRIWSDVLDGLRLAAREVPGEVISVGVDTWGVDYGLLDRRGRLLAAPVHYRDRRTDGAVERLHDHLPAERLYRATGIASLPINTLVQLWTMVEAGDPLLEVADRLLLMPDLIHHWLSGVAISERTIASTTQLLNLDGDWDADLVAEAGLSRHLLAPLVDPGTPLGALRPWIAGEVGLTGAHVVAPAGHDTASAVAACDGLETAAYLSSGTWSLMGIEAHTPVTHERARAAGITNERGVGGTFRVQRNLAGLWPLQSCLDRWRTEGHALDWDEVVRRADAAPAGGPLVDLDDPVFLAPDDMEQAIGTWCEERSLAAPEGVGEVARCCFESLALTYRRALRDMEAVTGRRVTALRVVGGGARNALLAQWTADACGVPVLAGPVEATALGNILVQAVATGAVPDLASGRAAIAVATQRRRFEPRSGRGWDAREARVPRRQAADAG